MAQTRVTSLLPHYCFSFSFFVAGSCEYEEKQSHSRWETWEQVLGKGGPPDHEHNDGKHRRVVSLRTAPVKLEAKRVLPSKLGLSVSEGQQAPSMDAQGGGAQKLGMGGWIRGWGLPAGWGAFSFHPEGSFWLHPWSLQPSRLRPSQSQMRVASRTISPQTLLLLCLEFWAPASLLMEPLTKMPFN